MNSALRNGVAGGALLDTNGLPLSPKFIALSCDWRGPYGVRCKNQATRGARLIVPPVNMETPEFRPLRRFTDLHACDLHTAAVSVTPADILTPNVKADFEAAAKKIRPAGFKCDFEAASLQWILTTTPEYRQFLQRVDFALSQARARGAA